jgi:hypothetical protein
MTGPKSNKLLLAMVLFLVCLSSCNKTGVEQKSKTTESDAEGVVNSAVSDPEARNFVMCQLRSAIWGRYDAMVEVESALTSDKKSRRFEVKSGHLTTTVSDAKLDTRTSRANLVRITDKDDAFSRGVPFFIDEVKFVAPDSLSFRLWSNPAKPINSAAARIQSVQRGESGYTSSVEIVDTPHPVASGTEPKVITMKENRLDGWVLSIVTTDRSGRCLVSNEIELASVLGK